MEQQTDIAIIGGGLASLAAALELSESGVEVTLIRKAPGATALTSGEWDLAMSPLRYSGEVFGAFPDIAQNLADILHRRPHHPYSLVQKERGGGVFELLKEGAIRLAKAISLSMTGNGEQNLQVVTEMGTSKPTGFVPSSMAAANLSAYHGAKVLLVGVEGLPNFNASFIRQTLREAGEKQPKNYLELVGHVDLPHPAGEVGTVNPMALAPLLDREEFLEKIFQSLESYLQQKVYSHLLFPPVLGMEQTSSIIEYLRKKTGMHVAEVLAGPQSVPGWRLSEAILKYFHQQEYRVIDGEVVGFDGAGGKVKSLRIHRGEERIRLHVGKVILASGKFLGGGIKLKKGFLESIFNLPLFWEGERITKEGPEYFTLKDTTRSQPFLSLGLRINGQGQVVDGSGRVPWENLFAAGRILAGTDPTREGCAAGVDIMSGTLAAQGAQM